MSPRVVLLAAFVAVATACGPQISEPSTRPEPSPSITAITPQPSPSPSPSTSPSQSPSPSPSLAPTGTPAPAPTSPGRALVGPGDHGPAVLLLQRRLVALGYWLGVADGVFGDTTEQAVYAVQKAAGIARDGVVGTQTRRALAQGVVPSPRSTSGRVVEIDLSRDLLLIVTDGHLHAVLNASSGGGYTYVDQGVTSVASTPTGHFTIYWQYDGLRISSLGELWRPKFFVGGYAIHGYDSVPPYPASHGCVRVSDPAIDWIWSSDQAPLGTAVWVY